MVQISGETLEFCRDALIKQIDETYDDPAICEFGVAYEMWFLRKVANDLGVDFDKTVDDVASAAECERMAQLMRHATHDKNFPPRKVARDG